jgi:hypothetical protein
MGARPTPRRLLSLAALAAAVAATSACGGGGGAQAAPKDPPVSYADQYLSFTHPAAWTASTPSGPTELHFQPIVYLSTQPVGSPCTANGNETACGWPIKRLRPGGVLVVWQFPYLGPQNFTLPGKPLRVGGHRGGIVDTRGGTCRRIGADRTIDVWVELSPRNAIELTACLRGPGLARARMSVYSLLASAKFASR